mgnify:FL=1
MRHLPRLLAAFAILLLAGLPPLAGAQQAERFGDYEIHYSAMPTGLLNPAVAADYGILRSRSKALLMVTILHQGESVSGAVDARIQENDDPPTEIEMRRVRDDGWVSYIGTFDFEPGRGLNFAIMANPHAEGGPFQLAFRQALHQPE